METVLDAIPMQCCRCRRFAEKTESEHLTGGEEGRMTKTRAQQTWDYFNRSAERKSADTNYCVPCDQVREFYAKSDDNGRLHCLICDWALDEKKAIRAASR